MFKVLRNSSVFFFFGLGGLELRKFRESIKFENLYWFWTLVKLVCHCVRVKLNERLLLYCIGLKVVLLGFCFNWVLLCI